MPVMFIEAFVKPRTTQEGGELMRANSLRKFFGTCTSSAIAVIVAGTLMFPLSAQAVPSADLQAQAASTLDKLNALQDRFDQAAAAYTEAEVAREEAESKKLEAQEKAAAATDQIIDLQEKLSVRARGMYRSGALSILDVLTSATSFKAFTNNWDLLNDMNQADADMVQQTKDLRALVEEQEREAAAQEEIEAKKAAEAEQEKDEAEKLVNETRSIYDSLSAEAAEALEAERQVRDEENSRAFEATLAQGAVSSNSSSTSSSSSSRPSGGTSASPSYTPGTVLSRAWSKVGNASYVYGATGTEAFDCSGFVGWCLTGSTTRLGTDAYFGSKPIASNPQPGDVCYRPGHVGIYIGNSQMISASSPTRGICVDTLDSRYTIHRM